MNNLAIPVGQVDDQLGDAASLAQASQETDPQGIPWERLRWTREQFRQQRTEQLSPLANFFNVIGEAIKDYNSVSDFHRAVLGSHLTSCRVRDPVFQFYKNCPELKSSVMHFQLRNLLSATTANDIYAVHQNCIKHWNMVTGTTRTVVDMAGMDLTRGCSVAHPIEVCTACAQDELIAAGGFSGEIVLAREDGKVLWDTRVASSDNCITNGLEMTYMNTGARTLVAANNDVRVRLIDLETCKVWSCLELEGAANGASLNPVQRNLLGVVGDDKRGHVFDVSSHQCVFQLQGHLDWSFAIAWHPAGNLLATGNQDCTTRVWDIRRPEAALAVLPATVSAVRSCRFSGDGELLAVAEQLDFVHVYDLRLGLQRSGELSMQTVDFFGDISGISISPDSKRLFIGVANQQYNSTICYERLRDGNFNSKL